MSNPAGPPDDLALTALRFAAGDLSSEQAEAFAERMARDQAARDALSDAIRLSAAALGQPAPVPSVGVRETAVETLRPTVWTRLFPRQRYRGHPFVWAGMGGTVAAALTIVGVWLGDDPAGPRPPAPRFVVFPPGETERATAASASEPAATSERSRDEFAVEVAPPPSPLDGSGDPPGTPAADREPDRTPSTTVEGKSGRKPAVDAKIGDE